MSKRTLWFLAVLALCASCQKFAEGQRLFRDMMVLRGQIATQFREARVQVNVIGKGTVVVTFINSPLNGASREEKQKRADEVATFVMKNCKHEVPAVRTSFVSQSGGVGGSVTGLDRYTGHPARR
jgi:hypothetical protein